MEANSTPTAPAPTKDAPIMTPPPAEAALKREHDLAPTDISQAPRRVAPREVKESIVAAEITITGKIVGAGHVRIAGKFEGDVHIDGDLTIEKGAKLTGSIRAESVAIAGEVGDSKVELLASGVLNGDSCGHPHRRRRIAHADAVGESHFHAHAGNRQVS
jgi:hypothetical protein